MKKQVVFVAGAYRGAGWNDVWNNCMIAREHARKLWLKGYAVICPHANSIFMDAPDIPDATFLDGDLEILSRCDYIYLLPGWRNSVGARGEYKFAVEHGIPRLTTEDNEGVEG
jgi:hypothetical protein